MNKIFHGNSLEVLKSLEDNSVDAVVCDPPYELGFMGKSWDNSGIAYSVPLWSEALRVLKPGGYLLAFGGTRTYHRMAVAIEDAGFEIRDMIEWIYACLSEDTEILTQAGFKLFKDILPTDKILAYELQKDVYKWEVPEKWQSYKIHQDTAYRIQSDKTEQIVSRNHRCLVEREGELVLIRAEELTSMETVPTLPNNFYRIPKIQPSLLFQAVQWILSRPRMEEMDPTCSENFKSSRKPYEKRQSGREKSCMERRIDISKSQGKVCTAINKICSLPERIYAHGKKRWLRHGAQIKNCYRNWKDTIKRRMCASYQPQCNRQQDREFNVIQNKCRAQKVRTWASYNTTLATVTAIKYSGVIFCPTVSTGAFVAQRNGKVFITGNSGFPKSLDISKAINKAAGVEFSSTPAAGVGFMNSDNDGYNMTMNQLKQEGESTKEAKKFKGFGSNLKPAHEPICMARKPLSEKTIVDNVLKHGTGGLNIDACRIPYISDKDKPDDITGGQARFQQSIKNQGYRPYTEGLPANKQEDKYVSAPQGRFPANVLVSDDALNDGIDTKSGKDCIRQKEGFFMEHGGLGDKGDIQTTYGDEGSKSRYFNIDIWAERNGILQFPKPAKAEKNNGLDDIEPKKQDESRKEGNPGGNNPRLRGLLPKSNFHPTVKGLNLMSYLVSLVSKEGDTVLDPFAGSGTTLIAAHILKREYIGIELNKDYICIAEARLKYYAEQRANKELQTKMFE